MGLWLVIASKAVASVLLLVAFALLLRAGTHDPTDEGSKVLGAIFKGSPPNIAVNFLVSATGGLTSEKAYRLAGATLAYAILEAVEAVGLAKQKHWAEWLTVLVTASLIPFEVIELVKEPSAMKVGTLVMNAAILVFLIVRLVRDRQQGRGRGRARLAFAS